MLLSRSGKMTTPFLSNPRWRQELTSAGLVPKQSRAWEGVYRGRALELDFQGRSLRLSVRTRNRARLVDELRSSAPVPQVPWLTPLALVELVAFAQAPGEPERWQLKIQGEQLDLTCRTANPSQLRFLLDLVCDVAEGVDAFGEGR